MQLSFSLVLKAAVQRLSQLVSVYYILPKFQPFHQVIIKQTLLRVQFIYIAPKVVWSSRLQHYTFKSALIRLSVYQFRVKQTHTELQDISMLVFLIYCTHIAQAPHTHTHQSHTHTLPRSTLETNTIAAVQLFHVSYLCSAEMFGNNNVSSCSPCSVSQCYTITKNNDKKYTSGLYI